ncbi:hypothetical protein [Indioceanicola profundi]|uniref:hypothetical protein n=1 Tax=Indioceanicola profundi TaxID=2220096 RepID=UPI0013C48F6B|nr:hypothetical protein [Indioceanicola profundi]
MPIETEQDLERAVQEFQQLRDAPDDSDQGRRKQELDAEIKAYYLQHAEDMRAAKPPR